MLSTTGEVQLLSVIRVGDAAEGADATDAETANATYPSNVGCMAAVAIPVPHAIQKLQVTKTLQPSKTRWAAAQTTVLPDKLGPKMEFI